MPKQNTPPKLLDQARDRIRVKQLRRIRFDTEASVIGSTVFVQGSAGGRFRGAQRPAGFNFCPVAVEQIKPLN